MIYRLFFRYVLLRLDPEDAHRLVSRILRATRRVPGIRPMMRALFSPEPPCLEVRALGLSFANPLGVAAGVDKEADWFESLGDLGFGHVEVGTVTADGQEGNERPRIHRLPRDRALHNSMGFPNPGAAKLAGRLGARTGHPVVGVNIGKTRTVELQDAAADYRRSVRLLAPGADYIVLNVSSPNTPGLRSMQGLEALRALIAAVRAELQSMGAEPPLLVKIGPDLTDAEIEAIADLAVEIGLNGIVAVNTTSDASVLRHSGEEARSIDHGGISGAPLKGRSMEVLRLLYARAGGRLVLVSVGGVETAEDVWERVAAGATLVQAYTGFVYGGPLWAARINRRLARKVKAAGLSSLGELIGTAASSGSGADQGAGVPPG